MSLIRGDIVFSRSGAPNTVISKEEATGQVTMDINLANASQKAKNGVRNGLDTDRREVFTSVLEQIKNPDKIQEIENLSTKIEELKKAHADARVLRYLNGELQFRMSRESYQPVHFKTDVLTLSSY